MLIASVRLDLVPLTPSLLTAALARDLPQCERLLGATIPTGWPEPEDEYVLTLRLQQLTADLTLQPWLLRAMIHRESGTMVGHIGFHTAPAPDYLQPWSPAAVELGFTVFPEHRRQGYAREAVLAMMAWARAVYAVPAFIMTIRPDNHPSQNLAASLGFIRIGQHLDEIDGPEDVLELKVAEK